MLGRFSQHDLIPESMQVLWELSTAAISSKKVHLFDQNSWYILEMPVWEGR